MDRFIHERLVWWSCRTRKLSNIYQIILIQPYGLTLSDWNSISPSCCRSTSRKMTSYILETYVVLFIVPATKKYEFLFMTLYKIMSGVRSVYRGRTHAGKRSVFSRKQPVLTSEHIRASFDPLSDHIATLLEMCMMWLIRSLPRGTY